MLFVPLICDNEYNYWWSETQSLDNLAYHLQIIDKTLYLKNGKNSDYKCLSYS